MKRKLFSKMDKRREEYYKNLFGNMPIKPVGTAIINGERVSLDLIDDSRADITRVIFRRNGNRVTTFLNPELVTKY